MLLDTLVLFLPACFALNMAFGPSNLLALNNGARNGPGFALSVSFGRILAFAIMIAVSALGLGALLSTSAVIFQMVKIVGAAYLVWLGLKLLRSRDPSNVANGESNGRGIRSAFKQEFWVALGNPKAILIFTAFFPQFIDQSRYWTDFGYLGCFFLILELAAISLYACAGKYLVGKGPSTLGWITRMSGLSMIGFGSVLLFANRELEPE
ncbi:MAG: LysE family translocator [Cohaesibacteraceae bacterium]|nr:LysE family translocator [Cohaesibacteraceae bacterium]